MQDRYSDNPRIDMAARALIGASGAGAAICGCILVAAAVARAVAEGAL